MSWALFPVALSLGLLAACQPAAHEVAVSLRTNLEPGADFVGVQATLSPALEGTRASDRRGPVVTVGPGDDVTSELRVGSFDVAPGTYFAIVRLLDGEGAEVARGIAQVAVQRALAVVVTVDASCGGVTCPEDGRPMTCVAGRCVELPSCADGGDCGPRCSDAGGCDAGAPPPDPPAPPEPTSIFFLGGGLTAAGPLPDLVRQLASDAGHPEPTVESSTSSGDLALSILRQDMSETGPNSRLLEGWDAMVLQESTWRATDAFMDADGFKDDVVYFYDRVRGARESARVILFEPWAHRPGAALYGDEFEDHADWSEQVARHHRDAAEHYVPRHSVTPDVMGGGHRIAVAPVGGAWGDLVGEGQGPDLYAADASDGWSPSAAGEYLAALVLYGTLYERSTRGLRPLGGVEEGTAARLQALADARTGQTTPIPRLAAYLEAGAALRVDFGPTEAGSWAALGVRNGRTEQLHTVDGSATFITASVADFNGTTDQGSADNALAWPGEVTVDALWVGDLDYHSRALSKVGTVTLHDLPPGAYSVEIFASRSGDDGGRGRLTRYLLGNEFRDLSVSDNTADTASFEGVRPDDDRQLEISVVVSRDGSARYAYIGALVLTRTGD